MITNDRDQIRITLEKLVNEKKSSDIMKMIRAKDTESYEQKQERINQMGKKYSFADVCEAAGHLGAEYGQGYGHAGDDVPKDIISCNYLSWAQRIIDRLEANNADQG